MLPDKMPHSMKFHINDKMPHCSNGAYNAAIMSGGITPSHHKGCNGAMPPDRMPLGIMPQVHYAAMH